jgi:hypothetical protein
MPLLHDVINIPNFGFSLKKITLIGAPSVLQFENSREFANYTASCKIIGLNLKLCLGKCDTIKI